MKSAVQSSKRSGISQRLPGRITLGETTIGNPKRQAKDVPATKDLLPIAKAISHSRPHSDCTDRHFRSLSGSRLASKSNKPRN